MSETIPLPSGGATLFSSKNSTQARSTEPHISRCCSHMPRQKTLPTCGRYQKLPQVVRCFGRISAILGFRPERHTRRQLQFAKLFCIQPLVDLALRTGRSTIAGLPSRGQLARLFRRQLRDSWHLLPGSVMQRNREWPTSTDLLGSASCTSPH